MLDLAIIGSGPAALTAAIYASRSGLSVEVFEKNRFGGALTEIAHLANFPGFDGEGEKFAENLLAQAKSFGAKISYGTCTKISKRGEVVISEIDGEKVESRAVLVATGSEPRPLEEEISSPVSYCVLCDGALFEGKDICVVGGGNSALAGALHLSKIAKSVTLISHSSLKAQKFLTEKVKAEKTIKILENTEPTKDFLDSFAAVFVLIGKRPATTFVPDELLDDCGYIKTEKGFMTKTPGIFAAGDVRADSVKQAITAAAEGASAAISAVDFLSK